MTAFRQEECEAYTTSYLLNLAMNCQGVSGNWSITELGYKCLTEPCVYSRSPYTTELSACFHLISFSFGCERRASMEANKLAPRALGDLDPNLSAHFDFLLPSLGKTWTSLTRMSAKVLIVQKGTNNRNMLLFMFSYTLPSHTGPRVSVWKVSLRGVWEDKNLK